MYHHTFMFVIISESDRVENILREKMPLEDCDYIFRTVPHVSEAGDVQSLDIAYLYDGIGGVEFPEERAEENECIFLMGNGDPLLTDMGVVTVASEVWIMPAQNGYDDGLLSVYFNRLTERMKRHADARKQKICFETLIDSVPDISWFKDTSGAHLIVNNSFCETVGKTKEQIYKKGHCYIWDASKEDEEVCLYSDQLIMESGRTNTFEENVKTRTDIRLLKSYKSPLIDMDGRIFGTCGIAHDMTELRNMSSELKMVLDSIPFAVLVENMQDIVIDKNSRFDEYFPEFIDIVGKSSKEWKQSLSRKILMDDRMMEVVVQSGKKQCVLVFEEEPIMDSSQKEIGRIVTLMDITLERSISKENEHTANTDYLTGLSNRRKLMNHLERVFKHDDVVLVMLDLDNFKQVNDTFGHEAGDRALIKTAELLQECFEKDFVARMGGDEFMIVASGKTLEKVRQETEHLLAVMQETYQSFEEFSGITASAGIAPTVMFSREERNLSELLQAADSLLYKAKNNGKNCYFCHGDPEKK